MHTINEQISPNFGNMRKKLLYPCATFSMLRNLRGKASWKLSCQSLRLKTLSVTYRFRKSCPITLVRVAYSQKISTGTVPGIEQKWSFCLLGQSGIPKRSWTWPNGTLPLLNRFGINMTQKPTEPSYTNWENARFFFSGVSDLVLSYHNCYSLVIVSSRLWITCCC